MIINDRIYKIICEDCEKITYSFCGDFNCGKCKKLKECEVIYSPIEKIKPKSLVITKSSGKFDLLNYSTTDILHIGISNSKKEVFNFWSNYRIESESENKIWKDVINIELEFLTLDDCLFDDLLINDLFNQKREFSDYDQFDNNCYAYICRFLNFINYGDVFWSKESIAINLIENKISFIEKYSQIYKQLKSSKLGKIILDRKEIEYTASVCDVCNDRIEKGKRYRCKVCPDYDLCEICSISIGHKHLLEKI